MKTLLLLASLLFVQQPAPPATQAWKAKVTMDDGRALPVFGNFPASSNAATPVQIGIVSQTGIGSSGFFSARRNGVVDYPQWSSFGPGQYRVSLKQLPLGYYVKFITFGDVDLTKVPLAITASQADSWIEIVLTTTPPQGTPAGVTLSGHATNSGSSSRKSTDAALLLRGAHDGNEPDVVAEVKIGGDGAFEIKGVPPGRYTLEGGSGSPVKQTLTINVGEKDVTNLRVDLR